MQLNKTFKKNTESLETDRKEQNRHLFKSQLLHKHSSKMVKKKLPSNIHLEIKPCLLSTINSRMFSYWRISREGSHQIAESYVTQMLSDSPIQQIPRPDNVTSVFSDFQITFYFSFQMGQSFMSYETVGCFMNAVGLPS